MALKTDESIVGIFSNAAIQKQIDHAYTKVGPTGWAIVAHLDSQGEATATLVKRIGDHVSVEVAGVMDIKDGFKFDKEHLKGQIEVIGSW